MEAIKRYYKAHTKPLFLMAAFALPFFATLLLFAIREIYPFGGITFLKKDMYQQYTPFFYEFYRKIKHGETLWYSWNAGLGANFLAVIAYYLASPLNLLIVLFPEKYILEFMSYFVVIKTGLMGLTAAMYLRFRFKSYDPAIVFFSLCYAMSAFMAAYNWNVEWMDVLFIAPVTLMGLEMIMEDRSPLIYYLSLSYAIFTNYYLSIMLCIFLLLRFVTLTVIKGFRPGRLISFSLFSVLAAASSAVLLLPEYYALRFTTFTNIRFPGELKLYMGPIDILTSHLPGVEPETGLEHYPNIYCGLLIIFLVILYAFNVREKLKERICSLALLLFFILSFDINILNFIWHGLNFPDSLPARQGYLYTLLLITMAYEAFLMIRSSKQDFFFLSLALFYVLVVVTAFFSDKERLDDLARILTLVFSLGIVILCLFYRSAPPKEHFPGNGQELLFRYSILFTLMLEIILNMYYTNNRTVKREDYFSKYDDFKVLNSEKIMADTDDDSPLSRADEVGRSVRNNSMMIDYPSLSFFSSTTNGLIIKYLNKYGFMNSRVFYLADGSTAVTSLLSGQKYIFVPQGRLCTSDDIASPYKHSNGAALYEFNDFLPNGYVIRCNDEVRKKLFIPSENAEKIIDSLIPSPNSDGSPVEAQNTLMHDLNISGTALMSYGSIENGTVSKKDNSLTVSFSDACHLYAYNRTKTKAEVKVVFSDGTSLGKLPLNKYRYLVDLGYRGKGMNATFISEDKNDTELDIEFYRLNPSVVDSFTSAVNRAEKLKNIELSADELKGNIDMEASGELILCVPYEPGWKLFVDGQKREIDLFDGLWISTRLEKGSHDIRISFFPKGLKTGALISLLSVLTAILSLWYEGILRRRKAQAGHFTSPR
ncbi:MAG: YfhO family protein [Lachnospiraceae bacterium]|nr:YfhO family protein [Lachnospiraceae bacterium]